jgi:hypothetical protein
VVTENGLPMHEKEGAGGFVFLGACRVEAPKIAPAQFPTVKSNWWCLAAERFDLYARLGARAPTRK